MNPFFAYLIKSSICLTVLYCLFRFSMRNERNHTTNRYLLLSILLVSAIIPFLNIQFFYEGIPIKPIEPIREFVSAPVVLEPVLTETIQTVIETASHSINWILVCYVVLITVLLVRLLIGVIQVSKIIKHAEERLLQNIVLAVVKELIQPFSFLNKVVLSEKDYNENKNIVVTHEHAHIKQMHAIDLMVCELFTVMQFFNPFMWLLRRDLKLIHEYQADEAVLNKGIDAQKYQLLVLEKAVGERRFAMANYFTQKPILKRLTMMTKTNKSRWGRVKLILFVPILIVLLQAFARPDLIQSADDFIPVKYTENKAEKWLSKWTLNNIEKGFFEPDIKNPNAPRKPNNELVILMNANDEFLIENEGYRDPDLKKMVKGYLYGINPNGGNGPDYEKLEIPVIGVMKVSKGLVSFKHDINSSEEIVNNTLRAIGEAYLEVRDEKSTVLFDENYLELNDENQLVVNKAIPVCFRYEYPKAPPANVWKPFKDQQKIESKPIEMLVKYDGTICLGNQVYKSFEEFQKSLEVWTKDLYALNKKNKTRHHYRVNVTFEHGSRTEEVCPVQIRKIEHALWKEGVQLEQMNHVFPEEDVKFPLEEDKLKARSKQLVINSTKKVASNQRQKGITGNLSRTKYDVVIHSDRLEVLGETCSLSELKEKFKNTPDIDMISVLSFEDVSKQKLDVVMNELNQIPFKKVSKTVVRIEHEPVSKAQHKVLINSKGNIFVDGVEYNLKEFEARMNKIGDETGQTKIALELENDVTYLQFETVKRILRNANIAQVGCSIQKHLVLETNPGTKIGEPSYAFGFGWTGNKGPDLSKAKRAAESFLSGKGNRSLYASISPDKNATHEDVDAVRSVLLLAGFKKVEVYKKQK